MIEFTPEAREHVLGFLAEEEADLAVRIEILDSSPLAPRYDLTLIESVERDPADPVMDLGDFRVVVDSGSAAMLDGATVDWLESLDGGGFRIENPNIRPIGGEPMSGPLAERVRQVIDHQINPSIAAHGGSVSLVDLRDGIVYLRMSGGCQGCGMAAATLSQGIRRILRETVPDIVDIVDVTNHAAGTNPFYA
ncbi:MAG: NifU family protein [Gemmatimonadota bacterium]